MGHDGTAGVPDGLVEGGLEVGQTLLVCEAEVGAAKDAPDLGPEFCLYPGSCRDVDKRPDCKVGNCAMTPEDVLESVEGVVHVHLAIGVLSHRFLSF